MSGKLVLPYLQTPFYTRSKQKIVVKFYLLNEVGLIFKASAVILSLYVYLQTVHQMQAGTVFHHRTYLLSVMRRCKVLLYRWELVVCS